jgi:hypothetical protein
MEVREPMIDDQLRRELDEIQAEVNRRRKAKPFEPWAAWALAERQAALQRFAQRHGA